jgi:hypothetical protein
MEQNAAVRNLVIDEGYIQAALAGFLFFVGGFNNEVQRQTERKVDGMG